MSPETPENSGSLGKARAYRERMRARGFRPVQIWVPDTRTADFRTEAHRQSCAVGPTARVNAKIKRSSTRLRTAERYDAR